MKIAGCVVELDFGSGLEIVPQYRLGNKVTFQETLDGYGAAQWTFTLLDVDSPIDSAFLRDMRRARLTLKCGKPGAITSTLLVDGFTREAKWDYLTHSAEITCQDSSVSVATKRVQISRAMNPAGTLRTTILAGVLATFGVTSVVDCPGSVRKAITEAGDKTLLDWVSLFVAPAARRAYWRNGTLYVVPSGIGAPTITLTANDIRTMMIAPAPTNATNSILFSALLIDDTVPADGDVTTIEDEEGIYTPRGAIQRQNEDGSVDDIVVTPAPSSPISRKVTTVTNAGGLAPQTVIEEWKWMAAYAPRAKQYARTYTEDQPHLTHSGIVCYNLNDGDHWRLQDQETFQIWRRTIIEEFYSGSTHTGRRTTIHINHAVPYPAFGRIVNNVKINPDGSSRPAAGPGGYLWFWYGDAGDPDPGPGSFVGNDYLFRHTFLWENDQSSERIGGPIEMFTSAHSGYLVPALVIDDTFIRNSVGDIAAIRRRLTFSRGTPQTELGSYIASGADDLRRYRAGFPSWSIGSISEIVGSLAAPRGTIGGGETEVEGEFVIAYLPTTESTRSGHVQSVAGTGTIDVANRPLGFESEMALPAPGTTYVVDTALPVEDRRGPFTVPVTQPFGASAVIAINGEFQTTARNDYCETTAEEQNVAKDILRLSLAEIGTIEMDPRGDIRSGDSIALGMLADQAVLVSGNAIELDLQSGDAKQTLTTAWWPTELD